MPFAFLAVALLLIQEPAAPAGPRTVALPEDPDALALACGMVTSEHWLQMMVALQEADGDITANAFEAASDSWLARAHRASEVDSAAAVAYAEHLDPEVRRIQARWCVQHLWD